MIKENLNPNLDKIQKIKSLAGSIAHETRNKSIHGFVIPIVSFDE